MYVINNNNNNNNNNSVKLLASYKDSTSAKRQQINKIKIGAKSRPYRKKEALH